MNASTRIAASALLALLAAPVADAQCNLQIDGNWTRAASGVDDVALARSVVFVNPFEYPIDVCRLAMRLSNGGCSNATARFEVRRSASNGAPGELVARSALQRIPSSDGVVAGTFSNLTLAARTRYHLIIDYAGNPCGFFGNTFVQRPAAATGQVFQSWIQVEQSGVTFWMRSDDRIRFQLDYAPQVRGRSISVGAGCGSSAPCGTSPYRSINSNGNFLTGQNTRSRIAFEIRNDSGFPSRALCGLEMRMTSMENRSIEVDVEVWDDAGSLPRQRIGSTTLTVPPGSPSVVRASFANPALIAANSDYWVSLDPRGARLMLPIEQAGNPVNDATWNGNSWVAGPGGSAWSARTFVTTRQPQVATLNSNAPVIGQNLQMRLRSAPASASAFLLIGAANPDFDLSALGAPGCRLLSSGEIAFSATTNGLGAADVNIPLPYNLSLLGLELFGQYAVSQQINALQLTTTNGLLLDLGSF